jgi:hypothetical protein
MRVDLDILFADPARSVDGAARTRQPIVMPIGTAVQFSSGDGRLAATSAP